MKGARALASGMLILAAVCALPAVSAAQDSGTADTTATTTPTTTQAEPPTPPPSPPTGGSSEGAAAGTPGEAPDQTRTANNSVADSPPADTPSGGTARASTSKAHKAATVNVSMEDFFFSPASVTVHAGDLVTWHNNGKQPHTATADDGSFDTGTVTAGGSASHLFTTPGTFTYICTIHPNMKGTVRVLSSSSSGGSGGGGGGSAGSSSSGSSQSEASAVNSPSAAGDSNTLPMTGLAAGALALVGLGLLCTGLVVRYSARRSAAAAGRQLTLF